MAQIVSKKKDKFSFQQQYPFYTTCSPTTLKFPEEIDNNTTSAMSRRSRSSSIIIPVKPFHETENQEVSLELESSPKKLSYSSPPSSYWSWTFGITTFPFIVWGCPIYLLLIDRPSIRTTRTWLKYLFDCTKHPFITLATFILLICTVLVNIYFISLLATLIKSLFIDGVYKSTMFSDLIDFLRDIPVVIPLNYIWLRGFRINNIVSLLNQKYRKYTQINCGGYRLKLVVMMIITCGVHAIRYYSYKKYTFSDLSFFTVWKTVWEFSVDVFVTLTFPVYCTFCYAIRFELYTIKALVYEMISKRVKPNETHLNKFKILYTHAADHIDVVNGCFSVYLSVTIALTIIGTFVDAEILIASVVTVISSMFFSIFGEREVLGRMADTIIKNGTSSHLKNIIHELSNSKGNGTSNFLDSPVLTADETIEIVKSNGTVTSDATVDPNVVRQINAEIVCILLVYALLFFTIWQAVVTNDCARAVHVWLNDFVAGAGGTDVKLALMDLGVVEECDDVNDDCSGLELNGSLGTNNEVELIWGRNTVIREDGQTDQFLEKVCRTFTWIHLFKHT